MFLIALSLGDEPRHINKCIIYVAKYEDAVYVIHAFEKRTSQTREADIALARKRLADFLRLREQKKKEAR